MISSLPEDGKQGIDLFQGLLDSFSIFAPRVCPHSQVLVYRKLGEELAPFRTKGQAQAHDPIRRHSLNLLPLELNCPLKRFQDAGYGPEEGRFAGAVAPQQSDKISLGDLQGNLPDRLETPDERRYVGKFKQRILPPGRLRSLRGYC